MERIASLFYPSMAQITYTKEPLPPFTEEETKELDFLLRPWDEMYLRQDIHTSGVLIPTLVAREQEEGC